MKSTRTIYRANSAETMLWKISPSGDAVQVDLQSYAFGIIGVTHMKATSPWKVPPERAKVILKAEFDKYYQEALRRFKTV